MGKPTDKRLAAAPEIVDRARENRGPGRDQLVPIVEHSLDQVRWHEVELAQRPSQRPRQCRQEPAGEPLLLQEPAPAAVKERQQLSGRVHYIPSPHATTVLRVAAHSTAG